MTFLRDEEKRNQDGGKKDNRKEGKNILSRCGGMEEKCFPPRYTTNITIDSRAMLNAVEKEQEIKVMIN